jgi:hypothetical protein
MNQKWSGMHQKTTLNQSFMHEREIEIRQVADAAVNQLGRFAAGAAGEIGLLDERYLIAASNGVKSHTCARDAPTDDQDIKLLVIQQRKIVHAHAW